jgi:hypothetical protein
MVMPHNEAELVLSEQFNLQIGSMRRGLNQANADLVRRQGL